MDKLILFLVILFFGCVSKSGNEFKEYYLTGQLKAKYNKINEQIEGDYYEYYNNGNIKYICHFDKNIQNGKFKQFSKDGFLLKESNFNQGIEEDTIAFYYPNGNLFKMSYMNRGKEDRFLRTYTEQGILRYFSGYDMGDVSGYQFKDSILVKDSKRVDCDTMVIGEFEYLIPLEFQKISRLVNNILIHSASNMQSGVFSVKAEQNDNFIDVYLESKEDSITSDLNFLRIDKINQIIETKATYKDANIRQVLFWFKKGDNYLTINFSCEDKYFYENYAVIEFIRNRINSKNEFFLRELLNNR